jgi:hypothetical protein
MAKRKTEEESFAKRRPDAPQTPTLEIDFEMLLAASPSGGLAWVRADR